ncbi:hypothetical protein [Bacteroides oleiciplenus]|uniref:hypothetical protein n=1 Tax=Bacteroides oleiciplenus TaxID=626931 RepID=UPI0011C0CFA1|nr:hypothetical protein [Bacteroides oleiciplenus]
MRQAGVVTVVVQFLEGIGAGLGQGAEHVDVEGLEVVLVFRGDGIAGTGAGDGGFQPQVVLQGEQHLGTGGVSIRFAGTGGGLGQRLAGTGKKQGAGGEQETREEQQWFILYIHIILFLLSNNSISVYDVNDNLLVISV